MANHKKTETAAKLKKFYSNLSNAVKLAELEEGLPSYEWENIHLDSFFNRYLAKYFNYTKIIYLCGDEDPDGIHVDGSHTVCGVTGIYLNDGTMFTLESNDSIYFDINGDKGPNEYGRDMFGFMILAPSTKGYYTENELLTLPHVITSDNISFRNISREQAKQNCGQSLKTSRGSCTKLLEIDGWEFKDDYPLRL